MILRDNIDEEQKALDLAQVRHDGGVASGLDVSEAETLLDTTQATYVGLGVQRAQFEHALAVLLGKPPAEFSAPPKPLDLNPPVVPPGLSSDLLERRPDIAAAERNMAATNAQVGVARAAYFPNVALTGTGGFLKQRVSFKLFDLSRALVCRPRPVPLSAAFSPEVALQSKPHSRREPTYDESVADDRQRVLDGLSRG